MTYRTPAPTGDMRVPLPFAEAVRRVNALLRRITATPEEEEALADLIRRAAASRSRTSQKLEAVGHFVKVREHLDDARHALDAGINTATTQPEMPAASDETPLPAPLPSWRGER